MQGWAWLAAALLVLAAFGAAPPLPGFLAPSSAQPLSGAAPERVSHSAGEPRSPALPLARGGASSAPFPSVAALAAAAVALGVAAAARRRQVRSSAVARAAAFNQQVSAAGCAVQAAAQFTFSGAALPQALHSAQDAAPPASDVAMNLLMPKNYKWKKPHKPAVKPFRHCTSWKFKGFAPSGNKPVFGKYALQATEEAWISNKAIENVRRALVRTMERKGKIWIRVFPHQAITKRVAESRYGAGKGSINSWVQAVRPGFILFELDGVTETVARNAMRKASYRIACLTKFVIKSDGPSRWDLGLAGKEKGRGREGVDPRLRKA